MRSGFNARFLTVICRTQVLYDCRRQGQLTEVETGDEKGTFQGQARRDSVTHAQPNSRARRPERRARLAWLRLALARFHDLGFLQEHARTPLVAGRFADGPDLQRALQDAIRRMQPSLETPAHAPAWRLHKLLSLRYLDGLTQQEAAAELGIGLRHFKREQQRAIEALDTLIFDQPAPADSSHSTAAPASEPASASPDLTNLAEVLRAALAVLDPVLTQQDLNVTVSLEDNLPGAQVSPMLARQLVINALGWLIRDTQHERLLARVRALTDSARPAVALELEHPLVGRRQAIGNTLEQLARSAKASLSIEVTPRQTQKLVLRLPAAESRYVLMIDDNPDMLRLVQRQLQRASGLAFVGVSTMDQALSQIRASRPACILLDLMMPDHDGWEILRLLKTWPETASIPIVISSVMPEPDLARAMGAAAILPRPFKAAQLNEMLRAIIEPASAPKQ